MPAAARSLACLQVQVDNEQSIRGTWGHECVPRLAPAVDDFGRDFLGLHPDEAHREDGGEHCDDDDDGLDRLRGVRDGAYREPGLDDIRGRCG